MDGDSAILRPIWNGCRRLRKLLRGLRKGDGMDEEEMDGNSESSGAVKTMNGSPDARQTPSEPRTSHVLFACFTCKSAAQEHLQAVLSLLS